MLVIQPFDKNAMGAMEKAIQSSDLGLQPSNDGNVIRLSFPPLTEERRRELIKVVKERAEEARVAVRNVRRHSKEELERLEHDHSISEDDLRRSEKELQKLRKDLGLDLPYYQQYLVWVWQMVSFNPGDTPALASEGPAAVIATVCGESPCTMRPAMSTSLPVSTRPRVEMFASGTPGWSTSSTATRPTPVEPFTPLTMAV